MDVTGHTVVAIGRSEQHRPVKGRKAWIITTAKMHCRLQRRVGLGFVERY
ncbi:Uncharacterised protein [Mycobacterium tuberculosis]|nr:Uncharacterised protein [Mycobacterium tuberculosis]